MKKYFPLGIVTVLVVIFFWKFFFQGLLPIPIDSLVGLYHPFRDYYAEEYPNGIPFKNFLITDPVRQQYVWRETAINQLRQSHIPGWNSYSFAGSPLMANYQSAAFYPLNLLFLFSQFSISWSVLVVLQPFLAGIFMFLYLKRMRLRDQSALLGGIVYAFCGFNMAWLTWNTLGHVIVWLPLILYLKENIVTNIQKTPLPYRKMLLLWFGLVTAESMYILAGHAQTAFYVFCVSSLYLFVRAFQVSTIIHGKKRNEFIIRLVVFFSLSAFFVAAVTAVQTIPFIQFVFSSARVDDQSIIREGWFIPLAHLIQFISPDFFGNPATLNYWGTWNYEELVGYIGVFPLLLVGVSLLFIKRKMVMFFVFLAVISLLLSTDNAIARLPIVWHIPFISTSQPTRLLSIIDFSLAILSALGFEAIINKKLAFKKMVLIGSIFVCIFIAVWLSVKLNFFNQNKENIYTAERNLLLPTGLALLGSTLLLFINRLNKQYTSLLASLIILTVVFDLFRFGWKITPFAKSGYLYPTTQSLNYIKEDKSLFRVMTTDDRILPANVSTLYRLQTIDGYDPLYLKNYGELASALARGKPDISPFSFNRMVTIHDPHNKIIDLMNVKYVLSLSDLSFPNLEKVYEEGMTKVYENKTVLPRALLISSILYASSKQEAIKYLFDQSIDFKTTAIMRDPISISTDLIKSSESVTVVEYTDNTVILKSNTNALRLLVLSDVYDPHWKVLVDNRESQLFEVNYAFRGVLVPEGNHTIVFRYKFI